MNSNNRGQFQEFGRTIDPRANCETMSGTDSGSRLNRSSFSSLLRLVFPFEATLTILVSLFFLVAYVWSEPSSKGEFAAILIASANLVRWVWWGLYLRYLVAPVDRFLAKPISDDPEQIIDAATAVLSAPRRFANLSFFSTITQWVGVVVLCDWLGWLGERSPSFVSSALIWAAAPAIGAFIFYLVVVRRVLAPYAEAVGELASDLKSSKLHYRSSIRDEIIWFALCMTFAPSLGFVALEIQTDIERQWEIARLHATNDAMRYRLSKSPAENSYRIELDRAYQAVTPMTLEFAKELPQMYAAVARGESTVENRRLGVVVIVIPTDTGYVGAVLRKQIRVPDAYILNVILSMIVLGIWAPACGIFMSTEMNRSLVRIVTALRSVTNEDDGRYARVPIVNANEIGDLTIVANDMLERLETSEAAVSGMLSELRIKNSQLADSFSAKSRFIANMSHELRTPLNAIIGFSRMTYRRADNETIDAAVLKRNMQIILRSGEHLLTLVDDLLDFEKIEAGAMQVKREKVVLSEAVYSIVETLELAADKKGLTIEVEPIDPKLVASSDRERFRQILTNLVNNAIKYSDEGVITVRCEARGAVVDIAVSDQGIGIPDARQALIFEPFRQLEDDTARTRDGAGLGLAIAARLCEMLDSSIAVESEVGVGSTFTLTVPRAKVRARAVTLPGESE